MRIRVVVTDPRNLGYEPVATPLQLGVENMFNVLSNAAGRVILLAGGRGMPRGRGHIWRSGSVSCVLNLLLLATSLSTSLRFSRVLPWI